MRWSATLTLTALTLMLAACGTQATGDRAGTGPTTAPSAMRVAQTTPTMDHNGMVMGNVPYDAMFIDRMIMHHQGAVAMAQQALNEATRPEIKTLAQTIIVSQQAEITQMQDWRKAWYPDLAPTKGMAMDMGTMEISKDASKPFDQRFIEAMIPHHQSAVTMAKDAQQKAEHAEVKQLAIGIITAQEREIIQMQQWQQEWFGTS